MTGAKQTWFPKFVFMSIKRAIQLEMFCTNKQSLVLTERFPRIRECTIFLLFSARIYFILVACYVTIAWCAPSNAISCVTMVPYCQISNGTTEFSFGLPDLLSSFRHLNFHAVCRNWHCIRSQKASDSVHSETLNQLSMTQMVQTAQSL